MTGLRFPIGEFAPPRASNPSERDRWMEDIAELPGALRAAVDGLGDTQLDTPYRPGGWTVRQVVHHVADSHMTSYIRFKLALTEDEPTIQGYDQDAWARQPESLSEPVELSLDILDALHRRWVVVLRNIADDGFARAMRHSESGRVTLEAALAYYSWHSKHHVAHIATLRQREGW